MEGTLLGGLTFNGEIWKVKNLCIFYYVNCEGLPDEQSRNKNCSGLLLNNGMGFNGAPVKFLALFF